MKKIAGLPFVGLIVFLTYVYVGNCYAATLVLSQQLNLEYEKPLVISHTEDFLIVKYKDWYFSHSIINAKSMHANIDLSGMERQYIKSMFDKETRNQFPRWLAELSKEQAQVLGVPNNKVDKSKIGEADIIAVYNEIEKSGFIYIFEALKIHNINVVGSKTHYYKLINSMEER